MTHPELPPNCPYFATLNGVSCFRDRDDEYGRPMDFVASIQHERRIIACVAAEYWLAEWRRLGRLDYLDPARSLIYPAELKAADWRTWGGLAC